MTYCKESVSRARKANRVKKNPELRKYAKKKGVLQRELAEALRISQSRLSARLSSNLHPAQYRLIVNTIDRIAAGKAGGGRGDTNDLP